MVLKKEKILKEEKEKEYVRKIGIQELVKAAGLSQEEEVQKVRRRRIEYQDPYFALLDKGRDLIIWKKHCTNVMRDLPKLIGQTITELESLMREMTADSLEDEYDYNARADRYYANAARAQALCMDLNKRLGRFMKNAKEAKISTDIVSTKGQIAFMNNLKRLSGISNELASYTKGFVEEMDKEFGIGANSPVMKRSDYPDD
ncbi:MAG: hypothetical protein J6P05_01285 [Lachnospiraceae bacterium]|nr:hypothetical protein [Lachnospiraceae bacterium]